MECCGFSGPQEFAYSTLPIDDSCYEPHTDNGTDDDGSPIARSDWDETTFTTPHMRLKQVRSFSHFSLESINHLSWPWNPRMRAFCLFYPGLLGATECLWDIGVRSRQSWSPTFSSNRKRFEVFLFLFDGQTSKSNIKIRDRYLTTSRLRSNVDEKVNFNTSEMTDGDGGLLSSSHLLVLMTCGRAIRKEILWNEMLRKEEEKRLNDREKSRDCHYIFIITEELMSPFVKSWYMSWVYTGRIRKQEMPRE